MRSPVSTWFSRRLARMSIAAFLAVLMVGGVAFASGALLHPPKAQAANPPLINIPVQYRPLAKQVTNCVLMASFNVAIAYVIGAPVATALLVPRGALLAYRAARIAIAVDQVVAVELSAAQEVTAANIVAGLAKVSPDLIKLNAGNGCLGIVAFNLNNSLTNWIWGNDDPMSKAQALEVDASVLCSNVAGATFDATTFLCQKDDGTYVQPDGSPVGATPCALTPGTGIDPTSGFCSDFGGPNGTDAPTYFGPYGDRYGQCQTGYPIGNGATCADENGNLYSPDGTSLNPPSQPADNCSNYLVGNADSDPCDYSVLTAPEPTVEVPTATPDPNIWCVARSGVDWANWSYYPVTDNFFGGIASYPVYLGSSG
ncbi:MAG: hypothetical protein H0X24_15455, partial [Ktedonobacterales bacterium]|nr:hypothetical protein [Ktedonobacterales bacterium]